MFAFLPPITKTIKVRRTRHAGHCWRSRDKLTSDLLLWTPSHGQAKAGRPARTYIQQLCVDTGCSPEDLPEVLNDREGWRERVRDIHADGTRWWWWIIIFLKKNYFKSLKSLVISSSNYNYESSPYNKYIIKVVWDNLSQNKNSVWWYF